MKINHFIVWTGVCFPLIYQSWLTICMFSCSQWQILEKSFGMSCCQLKVQYVLSLCFFLKMIITWRQQECSWCGRRPASLLSSRCCPQPRGQCQDDTEAHGWPEIFIHVCCIILIKAAGINISASPGCDPVTHIGPWELFCLKIKTNSVSKCFWHSKHQLIENSIYKRIAFS